MKDTDDAGLLRIFLERFPASRHAREAEEKIAALGGEGRPDFQQEVTTSTAVRHCKLLTEALYGRIVDVGKRRIRPREILEACEKAAAEQPNDAETAYRLAQAYNNLDNYKEYERELVRAAELGSIDAKLSLGSLYSSRYSDLRYDPGNGLRLLLEVAEANSGENDQHASQAARSLANLFQYGPSHIKDEQKRRYWYDQFVDRLKAAAEAGNPDALYTLGFAYMWGDGERLLQDPERAREILETAVARGNIWSLHSLATWYMQDKPGFRKDESKAFEYFQKYERVLGDLHERGYKYALVSIAYLYNSDPKKDARKALNLNRTAAEEGTVSAYSSLSSLYGSKENAGIYDPREARRWQLKYLAARGNCGYSPHEAVQQLHSDIDMLSTPEKAARCYLDAQKRFKPLLFHFRIGRNPTSFESDHNPIPWQTKMAIQRILKDEGFYSGPIDGVFGKGTFNSIVAYRDQ